MPGCCGGDEGEEKETEKKETEEKKTEEKEEVAVAEKGERKERKRGGRGGSGGGGGGGGKKKNNKHPLTMLEMNVIRRGQLARVLLSRMGTGTMTSELVAMAPSCSMWEEAMASYVERMEREGKSTEASLSRLVLGRTL